MRLAVTATLTDRTPLLEMRGISKAFPGVQALQSVSFDLWAGEVHALVGENGAGKSTLVKIIAGLYHADAGEIRLDGEPVVIPDPVRAQKLGISPVHQELSLEPYMSVAENIFLGQQPRGRFGLVDARLMMTDAAVVLRDLGVAIDPSAQAGSLSVAEKQMVAIARAVSSNAKILILDEPTSSLTNRETEVLFGIVERVRKQGFGVIYISHRMDEIFRICDRMTVFRDGRLIGTRAISEVTLDEVIQMMIGRELGELFKKKAVEIGGEALVVEGLSKRGVLDGISFQVRSGEIVGIAGLMGSGRTELARCIFGDLAYDEGRVVVAGKELKARTPADAIAAGIGLVPEDRKEQGLILSFSVAHNTTLALLRRLCRFQFIPLARERRLAAGFVERLRIKTPGTATKVSTLSGGNQQRVVIAKWLAIEPRILIVDEPTRGIDVAAKAEIHALLCDLAATGVAIVMISSELPEVLAMSDRILVMHQGRISGELRAAEATQDAIMRLATGQSVVPLAPLGVGA